MQIILISVLVCAVVMLAANAGLVFLRDMQLEKRLKGKLMDAAEVQQEGIGGNILSVASNIGKFLEKSDVTVLKQMAENIKINLSILGDPFNKIQPHTFIGIQLLSAVGVVIFSILILAFYDAITLLVLGVFGFFLPQMIVKSKVKAKHKAIFRQLPDVLDLLTLMVEAGLDFGAALNKIIESEQGPLIDEFFLSQQEIKLGKSRVSALNDMAERLNYLPLNTVINSLNLAFKTGGSIAPTLRVLSEQFRVERAQMAEKMAGEAPLKLMAPLILLIFPTIFIIIFGPIVLSFLGGRYW
ncbi:MAG: type II secretion system F family protein [Elusimicrobiota bacterium]